MSTKDIDRAVDSNTAQQLQQGFDALNRGQLEMAAQACQAVLAKHSELAPAHFLVGLIAIEGDERRVAHEAFKSVVKLDRDHAAAWAQLARLNASRSGCRPAPVRLAFAPIPPPHAVRPAPDPPL